VLILDNADDFGPFYPSQSTQLLCYVIGIQAYLYIGNHENTICVHSIKDKKGILVNKVQYKKHDTKSPLLLSGNKAALSV
jgi:hypothetical protein